MQRELREEVGLLQFALGPLVWRRQHTFNWMERRIAQRESYYVIETERFEPRMSDPVEAKTVEHMRWWTVDELHQASERLTPLALAQLLTSYLRDGAPRGEMDVEILVD